MLGIGAALFFSVTFVLNRAMELSGGSWVWSASLRYFFMIPFLLVIVLIRKNFRVLLQVMMEHPGRWIMWSSIGFGLFYAPLCFASAYSPGWLIAGTWQITIISGSLLAPLFYETVQTAKGAKKIRGQIPLSALGMSAVILLGVVFMQVDQAQHLSAQELWLGIIPVVLASFAYPLGNRKMMELCSNRLDAYQRVLGMTLASLPVWLLLAAYGIQAHGLPSAGQTLQSGFVALCSGVIATVLFFKATDMVRGDMQKLASVEATQSMEVIFTFTGEFLFLSLLMPTPLSWWGILLLMIGMIGHSYVSRIKPLPKAKKVSV
jgi:drug/metabolite transporter (DMT)-like permease